MSKTNQVGAKPARPKQNPETVIMKSIIDSLAWRFRGRLKIWRNNTGATKTAAGGFVRYGEVGSADIFGVLSPEGRFVALEVKQPGKKPTAAQSEWLREVKEHGWIAAVVSSPEEAVAAIEGELL